MKLASSLYSFLSDNQYLLPLGIIGLTLLMLLLTLMPSDFLGKSRIWSFDKLGHVALFGSWCFSVGLYYQITRPQAKLWLVFASGVAFGLVIEILQFALPLKRHADPLDFVFDIIGCLAAVWILKKIRQKVND